MVETVVFTAAGTQLLSTLPREIMVVDHRRSRDDVPAPLAPNEFSIAALHHAYVAMLAEAAN